MWRRHPVSGHEEQRGDQGRADTSGLPCRRRARRGQRIARARCEDRRLRHARVTDPRRHCRSRVRLDGLVHRPGQQLHGLDSAQEPIAPFLHAPNTFMPPTELRQNDRRLHGVEPETPPEKWSSAARSSCETGLLLHLIARALWLLIVLFEVGVLLVNLPAFIALLHTACSDPTGVNCNYLQLRSAQLPALAHSGFSLDGYALYALFCDLIVTLLFLSVGILIFWHKSADFMGLFVSLLLLTFGCFGISEVHLVVDL